MRQNIYYLNDEDGQLVAVQISAQLWNQVRPHLQHILQPQKAQKQNDDLEAFKQFLKFWDFKYPYSPAVKCPRCQTTTSNWQNDPMKPFVLTNANLGGLLVFHCQSCGSTIKQMHFKDHVATEAC